MTHVEFEMPLGAASRPSAVARLTLPPRVSSRPLPEVGICAAAVAMSTTTALLASRSAGWVVLPVVALIGVLLALDYSTLQPYERLRSLRPARNLSAVSGAALIGATAFGGLAPASARGVLYVVGSAVATIGASVGLDALRRKPRTVLVVGGRASVDQFVTQWSTCREIEIRGICLAEFPREGEQGFGIPVYGTLADVAEVAVSLDVDEVIVAPGPMLTAHDVRRLSWAMDQSGIELSVAAEVHGAVPRRVQPRVVGRRLVLTVRPGTQSGLTRTIKAGIDHVGAAVLLIVLALPMIVLALLIRRDSPGNALFKQTRVGLDGTRFTMYKFRTMVIDAEALLAELLADNEGSGPLFKMADDPRTTRIGRLLRRTSLDELPQLINVLRGEMSLIGPRPCLPSELDQYDGWIRRRLRVKPGMTGMWQVSGRSNLGWDESVRLDIDYADNLTIRQDFVIAAKTARAVLQRDGAM